MRKQKPYPSWAPQQPDGSRNSLEQRDGVPDFRIFQVDGTWFVKWRTSAMYDGPYASADEAVVGVEADVKYSSHR